MLSLPENYQAAPKRPSAALRSSFVMMSRALQLNIFEQPVKKLFSKSAIGR
jgi:hypothetical protein